MYGVPHLTLAAVFKRRSQRGRFLVRGLLLLKTNICRFSEGRCWAQNVRLGLGYEARRRGGLRYRANFLGNFA